MLELDRRDRAHLGRDDVGRVEPPAEPDLENRQIDRALREVTERQRGHELEVGCLAVLALDRLRRGRDVAQRAHEVVLGDRLGPDPDALARVDEVWAREDARGVPALADRAREHLDD